MSQSRKSLKSQSFTLNMEDNHLTKKHLQKSDAHNENHNKTLVIRDLLLARLDR